MDNDRSDPRIKGRLLRCIIPYIPEHFQKSIIHHLHSILAVPCITDTESHHRMVKPFVQLFLRSSVVLYTTFDHYLYVVLSRWQWEWIVLYCCLKYGRFLS